MSRKDMRAGAMPARIRGGWRRVLRTSAVWMAAGLLALTAAARGGVVRSLAAEKVSVLDLYCDQVAAVATRAFESQTAGCRYAIARPTYDLATERLLVTVRLAPDEETAKAFAAATPAKKMELLGGHLHTIAVAMGVEPFPELGQRFGLLQMTPLPRARGAAGGDEVALRNALADCAVLRVEMPSGDSILAATRTADGRLAFEFVRPPKE